MRVVRSVIAPLLLVFATLVACERAPELPAPARDLPRNNPAAQLEFDRRIKTAFPIGANEAAMVERLRRQGFKVGRPARDHLRGAIFTRRDGWYGSTIWRIDWRAKDGRVTKISGVYGFIYV